MEGQPAPPYAAVFPAHRDAFPRLRSFVEETCTRAGVAHPDGLRVMLLIEELFVNTVEHGHGRDSAAPVRVALTLTPSAIAVDYADTARPFDPFASVAAPSDTADVEARPVGGVGVALITTMADDARYVREDGWNRITFRVARSA